MRARSFFALAVLVAGVACDKPSAPPPVTGTLELTVSGLPDTIDAGITVTGPGGYSARITSTGALPGLVPGAYTVVVAPVRTDVATFDPAFETLPITISGSAVSRATVIYSVTTGAILVTVTGTPPDVPGKVVVTGPAGFRDSVSSTTTLGNLAPGTYTLTAAERSRGTEIWVPRPPLVVLTVAPSVTPFATAITYALTTGSLSVHVNGLPVGVQGAITVTGPGGFSRPVTGSQVLDGLREGRYDLVAAPTGGGGGHTPAPASQSATVVPGATAQASVNYWPSTPPPGLNLAVEAVQVQQVVQTYGGAVPVIAGRDGLLRVFVRASGPNAAAPSVRVRLYSGSQLTATAVIPAASVGVPATIDEGLLAGSWNYPIPASLMQPGLRVLVDVDPDNTVPESVEDDNVWPSSGTPLALDVRTVPPLAIRLVPITQAVNGLTGNVTEAIARQYEAEARRLLPVGALTVDVRQPYVTSAPAIQPNDGNGAWVQILSELNALRALEATTAHYYGVIKAPYASGVVGISYLPSVVALGWDSLPHGTSNMVHELGHNFGRLHSPSCGAGGRDANYPYEGGTTGVWGYDQAAGSLISPLARDIMGYCDGRWISDYTYAGILAFRASQPAVVGGAVSASGLLVWGRIGSEGVVLEPAFDVVAPSRVPVGGGPHRIELLDERGDLLFGFAFRGDQTVDASRDEQHFAFVVPYERLRGRKLATIRVRAAGRQAERSSSGDALSSADFAPAAQRASNARVRVRWPDTPGHAMLVRDAETGAVLSIARGGVAEVYSRSGNLDLVLSDGVRSTRRYIRDR